MLSVIMKSYVPYNPILYIIPCIIPYLSNDNIYYIWYHAKIPYQKPSSRISDTEQRPESTSKGSDQRCKISVRDDPGSTSCINDRDGRDGRG